METAYSDKIYDIAVETFQVTCYMFPLEEWEMEEQPQDDIFGGAVRSVVYFSGAAQGKMVITASGKLLTAIAANMLGIDDPDNTQKEGALCEVANIICGNTVPLFARDDKICTIRPPEIAKNTAEAHKKTTEMEQEALEIFLDEGAAKIIVYYTS